MRGYSYEYIQWQATLAKTSPRLSTARLGAQAVRKNISVSSIAKHLGVSRMAVYDWFAGRYNPKPEVYAALKAFIQSNN